MGKRIELSRKTITEDKDGNALITGKVTAGSSPVDVKDLTNKEYVDNAIAQAAIDGEVDTSGFALKTELPTKTSQLTNDSGFITSIPDEYVTNSELEQTLIPFGQELDKKSDILNYSDHSLNGTETYNNLENIISNESEAIYMVNKPINLFEGTTCSVEVKFSDNTNLLLQGEVVSVVLYEKKANCIQITSETAGLMVMVIDKARYTIKDGSVTPEHDDNVSTLIILHPNANNVISLTITKPTTFEINNNFFTDYQFVNDTEKENWNNKADKTDLFSGSYNDLTNKPVIPTKLSDLTDQVFIDEEWYEKDLADFETRINTTVSTSINGIASDITELFDANEKNENDISELYDIKANKSDLKTVATSGSYNDLTNKPVIPSIQGLANESYVDNAMAELREEMVILEEDDLTIDGLVDESFPSLTTEDKTLIGAINEINSENESLQNQMNELFQNVSSGKELIASAITDKGVDASEEETFQSLSEKINQIPVGPPGSNIIGYINENNDIYVSLTELESGTYTLKFEDYTGLLNEFDDIGTVEV